MPRAPEETISLHGLKSDAVLWRDPWGIPHIEARTDWDAFLLLGYAHAEDRLWQMDMQRRRASGRWAEWSGPSGVEADLLARRLGGRQAAERDHSALDDESRSMLDAYAAGVNAFIGAGRFPREYELLSEAPEPWLPWHSIAVMRQIGLLMGSFWMKLFRAAALPSVGPNVVGKLRYDDGGLDLLCMPPGRERARMGMDLATLRPAIEALLAAQAPDLMGGGSNNWAISGKISATGRPILMGDPHRELEVPTMYSQAHIACGSFDAIGLTVPGVPGFPHVAHNDRVAWCVTHAFMDIHDIYVERLRNGGGEARFLGGWEPTTRRTETIRVRGAADLPVEIVETRHGPVIASDPESGAALALKSIQFVRTDTSFNCLPKMLKSNGVRQLYDAVAEWGVIDHNLVAADVDGRIGHRVRAKVPRRSRANGWLPVPGWTGQFEWDGIVPFADMPETIDPPGGRIVTANNRVVEDAAEHYLCTDCHPPHRARRIMEMLDGLPTLSVETMTPIYMDLDSRPARLFVEKLRQRAGRTEASQKAIDLLLSWDCRMSPDSVPAAVYSELRVAVTRLVCNYSGLQAGAGASALAAGLAGDTAMVSHMWWVVPALLRADDPCLLGGRSWGDVLDEALDGLPPADQFRPWSDLHTPAPRHPLSPVFPDAAAELDMMCAPVGGDNDTVFATGFAAGDGFATRYSALARTSFDVGNWSNCHWIVFQGASGIPAHPHRADQNGSWAQGRFVPMLYHWTDIASVSSSTTFKAA